MASSGKSYPSTESRLRQSTRMAGASVGDWEMKATTAPNGRRDKYYEGTKNSLPMRSRDRVDVVKSHQGFKAIENQGLKRESSEDKDISQSKHPKSPTLEYPTGSEPQEWFKYFSDLETFMKKRQQHYSKPEVSSFGEETEIVMKISCHMLESAKHIFAHNPRIYVKFGLEQKVWKTALYDNIAIVRQLRVSKKSGSSDSFPRNISIKLIEMGITHFKDIIKCFGSVFAMNLKPLHTKSGFLSSSDYAKEGARDLIYKLYTNVGDLYRYALEINPNNRLYRQQAFEYYEMARLCDVKKSRAFNQMAIVSTYMGDLFGTAYNFTRAVSVPIRSDGARYQLREVFHKAYEEYQTSKEKYWYNLSKSVEKAVRFNRNYRREIWILPGKSSIDKPPKPEDNPPSKEQHIASLVPTEVYGRFACMYVQVLGKLFTKVGMDCFNEVAEEALVYFEGLLEIDIKISFARFIQIVSMGLHYVDGLTVDGYLEARERAQMESNRAVAVQFILEMFSIAVDRLLKLTNLCDWNNPQMEYLTAGVMMWCFWLRKHHKIWDVPNTRPKFSIRRLENRRANNVSDRDDDVWVMFALFLTRLEHILFRKDLCIFPSVNHMQDENISIPVTPFPEVLVLSGFGVHIDNDMYKQNYFSNGRFAKARAQNFIRLKEIHKFGAWSVENGILSSTKNSLNFYNYKSQRKVLAPRRSSDTCGLNESNFWYWAQDLLKKRDRNFKSLRPNCNNARIVVRRKEEKVTEHPCLSNSSKVQEVWWALGNKGYTSDIVIIPKRLIVDTNCFINEMDYVKKLTKLFPDPIILPVSVVLELKGLSKGGLRTRHRERFSNLDSPEAREKIKEGDNTAEKCKTALEYINANMKDFKVITTTGRYLSIKSIFDRVQDDFYDAKQRNDDRILNTCRYLEVTDKSLRRQDIPRRLFRNTVLLTGDRCLRIRTKTEDIPERKIESVVFWAWRYNCSPVSSYGTPSTQRRRRPFNGKKQYR